MKRYLIIIILPLICCNALFAQSKKSKLKTPEPVINQTEKEMDLAIYAQAMKFGDASVAINSLYTLLAKHPDNTSFKDSLAHIYFQIGSFNQCLRVCEELNKTKPADTVILRMMAMSHQSLGKPVEAIAELESVIKITGNVLDMYQKAAIEYSIKRLQESKLSVEAVIAKVNDADKIMLYAERDKKQEVPLKAAAFNLYGMIAKDFNDTTNARLLFAKAIQIYPEFYFANANIKAMNEAINNKPVEQQAAKEVTQSINEKKKGK